MKTVAAQGGEKNEQEDITVGYAKNLLCFPGHHQGAESYKEITIDKVAEKNPGRQLLS